jgi:hypothetical protein
MVSGFSAGQARRMWFIWKRSDVARSGQLKNLPFRMVKQNSEAGRGNQRGLGSPRPESGTTG